ncbi:MAG: hypothetical protein M3R29_05250 [Verrucomicrobiota bacterium]|nr:hypothetical protein [Verrucomicrobiota bacterium]
MLLTLGVVNAAFAQFTPALLQNASYWGDGKAEFDFYDAQIMRGGHPRQCEALMIFVREFVDPITLARVDHQEHADAMATIRMNQIFTMSRGMFVEQQSLTANWRLNVFSLAHLSSVGTDSTGNFSKRLEEKREANSASWFFIYDTYRDGAGFDRIVAPPNGFFYDELPLRVRTIDFSKQKEEFEIQLAPSMIGSRKDPIVFRTAKLSFKTSERKIDISVQHSAGKDTFVLDGQFPFLLREWSAADGSHLKMKNSLKADYWNYNKPGDRERALKNPMLRHPD